MTSDKTEIAPAETTSRTERFAEWLLEREKAKNDVEIDRTIVTGKLPEVQS